MTYELVLCTCPNGELAEKIAETLVKKELAACVNIIPNITSIYQWEGKVVKDTEIQLVIKSRNSLLEAIENEIKSLHEYEVPEIISLTIQQGSTDYLNWISQSVKGSN